MFPEPIHFFGLSIQLFGIIAVVSIFLGYFQTKQEMQRSNISTHILPDLALSILIAAFIGARLLFVVTHLGQYTSYLEFFKIWEGGLIFYGGILGGILGGVLYCLANKISIAQISDSVALGLALGLTFSRLGCLAAGCCYGIPTHLPWGMAFHNVHAIARPLDTALHPTQLYLLILGFLIYAVLLLLKKRKTFEGELLLIYFILTSISRLVTEPVRSDSPFISSVIAFAMLLISSFIYIDLKFKQREKIMKVSVVRMIGFVLVASLLTACGIVKTQKISRGLDIAPSDVSNIVKGQSTEKDVIKLFGPPTKVRDTSDGGKELFYEYTKSGGPQWNLVISVGGGTTTKSLIVWLDKSGTVTDYAFKQS